MGKKNKKLSHQESGLVIVFVLRRAELFFCLFGVDLNLVQIAEQVCVPVKFEAEGIGDIGNRVERLGQVVAQGFLVFQIVSGDEVAFFPPVTGG